MSQDRPTIAAATRERMGSRYAQRLRRDGRMPVVVYGHGMDPTHVSVDRKEVLGHIDHGVHLLDIAKEGADTETCLIKDVQYDYLGTNIIHIDLTRVDLSEVVTVMVPIIFAGEEDSPGAKASGSIVEHLLTDLAIHVRADSIPDSVTIDISTLDVGQSFQIKDLDLPEGITCDLPADEVVVSIHGLKAEEEGEEEVADSAEPEVLSEKTTDEG
jgi:large subunit ribosomal protein L25